MNIKDIINEEINKVLNESVVFSIDGYNYNQNPETVLDVVFILEKNVWRNVISKKLDPNTIARGRENGDFVEYLAPDGYDALNDSGIINFYVSDSFKPIANDVVNEIKSTLQKLNIKSGAYKMEKSNSRNTEVLRIPVEIVANPTQLAPSFNMANGNFREVMGSLGFDVSEPYGVAPAYQLLKKIEQAKNNLGGTNVQDQGRMKQNPDQPNYYERQLGKDDYGNYYDRLEDMCRWALKNGFANISYG